MTSACPRLPIRLDCVKGCRMAWRWQGRPQPPGVLVVAALIRIAIAYANRSVLLVLKEQAGIDEGELSWGQRAVRLPVAVAYRALSGIATLVGGLALAICFRLFNPDSPFGLNELSAYGQSLAGSLTYATLGA